MRERVDRRTVRQAERQVLPDGHPLRRLRYRGGAHLPVGCPVPRARLGRLRHHGIVHRAARRRPRLRLEEGSARMGKIDSGSSIRVLEGSEHGFATTKVDALLNWAKKYSLFQYPFVTACCGMEFMAIASPRF